MELSFHGISELRRKVSNSPLNPMENPFHSQPGPSTPSGQAEEMSAPAKVAVPLLDELLQAPSFDRVETEPLPLTTPSVAPVTEPSVTPVETAPAESLLAPEPPAQVPSVRELTQIQVEPKSPFVVVQAPATASLSQSPFTMVQTTSLPKVTPIVKPTPLAVNRRMPKPSIPNEEIAAPNLSPRSIEKISSLQILLLGCLIAVLSVLMGLMYDVSQREGRWARRYFPQIFSASPEGVHGAPR